MASALGGPSSFLMFLSVESQMSNRDHVGNCGNPSLSNALTWYPKWVWGWGVTVFYFRFKSTGLNNLGMVLLQIEL